MAQSLASSTQSDGSGEFVDGRLLDGFLLLAAGGSSTPEDVVSVNLSSLQIVEVAAEDLTFFGNLDSLDVSDNKLSDERILEQFARLPRLSRLLMSCNSLASLQVPSDALGRLETLDLSHNELHGDVLAQLARLPRLVTLNLSSNCISSVPPEEELYGFQFLEELSLDANDLVQFVQWRALDVMPRLRKLSLASNRVKRLKDDAPDQPGDQISYFESLEELDLSQNEISHVEHLPAVKFFRILQKLTLSDNPCTRNAISSEHTAQGMKVHIQDTKPWYLCGSGCFKKRDKLTEPKLKMDRRRMRRVRSSPQMAKGAKTRALDSQLGVLDHQSNRLLVDLRGMDNSDTFITAATAMPRAIQGYGQSLPPANVSPTKQTAPEGDEDYSEEELARIFKEQTAKIENAFNQPVEEPASFRRVPPFETASSTPALVPRSATGKLDDDMNGSIVPLAGAAPGSGPPSRHPPSTEKSSAFLTGVDEGSSDRTTGQQGPRSQRQGGPSGAAPGGDKPSAALAAALGAAPAGEKVSGSGGASPVAGMLPPIQMPGQPGSRGSSASGISRGDPLDMMLRDPGTKKNIPDNGVREAMKALRAAALSEW